MRYNQDERERSELGRMINQALKWFSNLDTIVQFITRIIGIVTSLRISPPLVSLQWRKRVKQSVVFVQQIGFYRVLSA